MERRKFVYGSLIASQVAGEALLASPTVAHSPLRVTRLLDRSTVSTRTSIQYVLCHGSQILCLYNDHEARQFGIISTDAQGRIVWSHLLPKGAYLSLGFEAGMILIHAGYYFTGGRSVQNCLLGLDPVAATLTEIGPVGPPSSPRILQSVGDSVFIKVEANQYQIWRVRQSKVVKEAENSLAAGLSERSHVEMISPEKIAMLSRDGSSFGLIASSSGSLLYYPVFSQEIARAQAAYQARLLACGPSSKRVSEGIVVPAVGSDRLGTLFAFVAPLDRDVATILSINEYAVASRWALWHFPLGRDGGLGYPLKLIVLGNEVGVTCANGVTAWYPADPNANVQP